MSDQPLAEIDEIREAGHDDVIGLLRAAARHPHKGPDDTDASMLQAAAKRLRGGFEPGGSWTKQTVARVIELVAALIDEEDENDD